MGATRAIDDEMKLEAITYARKGLSLEAVAHLLGVHRNTLGRERQRDEDFNSDLMRALAQYEESLVDRMNEFGPDAGMAKAILVQRFPQSYSLDPRIRRSQREAQEGYFEDLNDPTINPAKDSTADVIGRLVEKMLDEDENANHSD